MYVPRHNREDDPETLAAFVRDVGFGALVSTGENGQLEATHVPLRLDTSADPRNPAAWRLELHLARMNPQQRTLDGGAEVLVIVQGPHAYVSATLHDPPESVSTWNYAAVHLRGTARVSRDADTLRRMVESLTLDYETEAMLRSPGYEDRLLERIVGVEIGVTGVEARFKLSQKETPETKRNVIDHLGASERPDDRATAALMALRPLEKWTG